MLVLSRNRGQSISIGDDIRVTVLSTAGRQVKIGINAPVEVSVHRAEKYEEIQRQRNGYKH